MTHGEITIEIKSDTLSEAISIRDFLVTFNQVLLPEWVHLSWAERGVCWRLPQNAPLLRPSLIGTLVSTVRAGNGEPCYEGAGLLQHSDLRDLLPPCCTRWQSRVANSWGVARHPSSFRRNGSGGGAGGRRGVMKPQRPVQAFSEAPGQEGSWLLEKEMPLFCPLLQSCQGSHKSIWRALAGGSRRRPLDILPPLRRKCWQPCALGCTQPTDHLVRTLRPARWGLCWPSQAPGGPQALARAPGRVGAPGACSSVVRVV